MGRGFGTIVAIRWELAADWEPLVEFGLAMVVSLDVVVVEVFVAVEVSVSSIIVTIDWRGSSKILGLC